MKIVHVTAALMLCAPAAAADDQFTIAGAGAASCGKWLDVRQAPQMDNILASWMQGFLSGLNIAHYVDSESKMVVIPDMPTILAYIDKFCRENPLSKPVEGALQLRLDLEDRREAP